jgi:hypothetical protein
MWDRDKVLSAFQQALAELKGESPVRRVRPRAVALRAHGLYCAWLEPGQKRPSADTFRKFATGQLPCPPVTQLLQGEQIRPLSPARLDRGRLRAVFEEAIQKMEARLLKGQARPLQIVRRAYGLYIRAGEEGTPRPSHRTFEDLIYGRTADPEIKTLIDTALKRKDETS